MVSQRTSAGDSPAKGPLNSKLWNKVLESSNDHHDRRAMGSVVTPPPGLDFGQHAIWVKVENTTGEAVREGEVLELTGSAVTELFNRKLMLTGVNPNLERVGWGITAQPIPAGEINRILLVGACVAYVLIKDEAHKYANRVSGSRVLESAAAGPVKILHKPTGGTPPEERECLVQLVDESSPEPKIVTPRYQLYAAFGGGDSSTAYNPNLDYGNVEGNTLAISTGNYIPNSAGSTATMRNRKFYPGDCYVWKRNSSGVLYNTGEVISCVNPTGLPIMGPTWCIARKVEGSDEWVATKIGEFANASKHFYISGESLIVKGNEAKIVRSSPIAQPESTASGAQDWAYGHGNDVFIHHPGTYTITFGAHVSRSNSWTADTSRYYDSDDFDYVDLPNPAEVEVDCLLNWNPAGGGSLASSWPIGNRMIYMSLPPKGTNCTSERTFTVHHTLDNWHGQPYLRLSLAMRVLGHGDDPEDTRVSFLEGWIHIRPEGGGVFGGNEGTGYNAFLGTSGAFQWWGGGDEPVDFDEDGVEI